VAVKALSLRGLADWKQLQLFEREAATLRGLSHPCIPAYLDYFEDDTERDRGFFLVQVISLKPTEHSFKFITFNNSLTQHFIPSVLRRAWPLSLYLACTD
jgi:serine/threonine protein kinase